MTQENQTASVRFFDGIQILLYGLDDCRGKTPQFLNFLQKRRKSVSGTGKNRLLIGGLLGYRILCRVEPTGISVHQNGGFALEVPQAPYPCKGNVEGAIGEPSQLQPPLLRFITSVLPGACYYPRSD